MTQKLCFIPLLWPSLLPCVQTPWPPPVLCTPPPGLGSAPSAVHMGQHQTQAGNGAASPGSWDIKMEGGGVIHSKYVGEDAYLSTRLGPLKEWQKDEKVTNREDENKETNRQRRHGGHSEGREREKREKVTRSETKKRGERLKEI